MKFSLRILFEIGCFSKKQFFTFYAKYRSETPYPYSTTEMLNVKQGNCKFSLLRFCNAAFTLSGFDDQERNLIFVKTAFQV